MPSYRRNTYELWANARTVPAERLIAFEEWTLEQMRTRLVWPSDPATAAKQLGQCRTFVAAAVADLGDHGYLFRPRELAALITERLDAIARLQKAGNVRELYPYFRATWQKWVNTSASALREQAMLCGSHVAQITERLLTRPGAPAPEKSLCELLSDLRREKKQRARAAGAPAAAPDLFQP